VMRKTYGPEFLIGASTHSLDEARAARAGGANFVVFGPVFETKSKREFGAPQGLNQLAEVASELRGFPVVAIGGVTLENAGACFEAGASGVAAIRLLNDAERMSSIVAGLRSVYK
jgi:thiamine-phosphate pyrophosphorylase